MPNKVVDESIRAWKPDPIACPKLANKFAHLLKASESSVSDSSSSFEQTRPFQPLVEQGGHMSSTSQAARDDGNISNFSHVPLREQTAMPITSQICKPSSSASGLSTQALRPNISKNVHGFVQSQLNFKSGHTDYSQPPPEQLDVTTSR